MATPQSRSLQALPSRELRRIRQAGTDDVGHDVRVFVNDKEPGSPLRCCLREAHVGERVALVAWRPRNVQAGCYMCAIRRR